MEHKLSAQERADLQVRHKKERDKRICDRIKAVLAYDDGYSYSEIARILLLDDETIRRHIEDYFSKQKLKPENGGGSSLMTPEESGVLKGHVERVTYLYVKEICAYVFNTFNKIYSVSGMTKWLKNNNFCYKKPHGIPAKANLEKQEEFKEAYEKIKDDLGENDVIYFADATHPQHQTQLAYGWIKKGVRKAEKMTSCQKRINIIGAINLSGHKIEYLKVDWVNAENVKIFLNKLINANPLAEKIHVFFDNGRSNKCEEIFNFVKDTKIILHYLPPYSPNLNPIERLWKIMHEQITYNKYYEKFSDFTKNVLGFFDDIGKYQSIIENRINDNFQKLRFV